MVGGKHHVVSGVDRIIAPKLVAGGAMAEKDDGRMVEDRILAGVASSEEALD